MLLQNKKMDRNCAFNCFREHNLVFITSHIYPQERSRGCFLNVRLLESLSDKLENGFIFIKKTVIYCKKGGFFFFFKQIRSNQTNLMIKYTMVTRNLRIEDNN